MFLAFVCWVVLGLMIGFLASKVAKVGDDDPRLGIAAGGAGGLIAGVIFSVASSEPSTVFNLWSLPAAATGALVAAVGWYIFRGYASRA